jgi:ABC-type lipoprotein release transport system permease subunit
VQILSALVPVGGSSAPVVVKGGTYQDIDSIYKLSEKIIAGEVTLDGDRILVGKEFAEQYGLAPGDTVELVLADGSTVTARLEGVFDLGSQAANQQSVFAGLDAASAAVGRSTDEVSAVETQIDDVFVLQRWRPTWRSNIPNCR